MAKLPKYMKLEKSKTKTPGAIPVTIKIKQWGWLIIVFNIIRDKTELPWWKWFLYPSFCIKLMAGWF